VTDGIRPRQLRGLVIGVTVSTLLVAGSLPATRRRPDRVLLLVLAAYACFEVRKRLGVGSRPVARAPRREELEGGPDEQDVRLARLDASFARAAESGEQFARVTRPMLRRLVADRLRATTGIDVDADPAGARRQMGEELWEMFSADPAAIGPAPGPERLRALVAAVERL
jgi:hypothetical protein